MRRSVVCVVLRQWVVACGLFALVSGSLSLLSGEDPVDGRELFEREWLPQDARSHGGDGLGPVFNDSSCVACHNQGGVGGAGAHEKNVQIITPFVNAKTKTAPTSQGNLFTRLLRGFTGKQRLVKTIPAESKEGASNEDPQKKATARLQREELAKIHPGFRTARSLVLHRAGVDDEYAKWRSKLTGVGFRLTLHSAAESISLRDLEKAQVELAVFAKFMARPFEPFRFVTSERNPLPLFGLGKLDSIPDKALVEAAETAHPDFPDVSGRVARLKDGRIGRFGWKAQKASLGDFVLTACAVELGLNVPGEAQSGVPHKPDYRPPGLDLTLEECNALTSFITKLPQPLERKPRSPAEEAVREAGKSLFAQVGCESCHVPKLGEVQGIYSDLLLHDMGPELGDSGTYGAFVPDVAESEDLDEPLPSISGVSVVAFNRLALEEPKDVKRAGGATRLEWRTPPLWGLRDSAPYLHDGRAATLEQAIALHGGEADKSSQKFFGLSAKERLEVLALLKSLTAP